MSDGASDDDWFERAIESDADETAASTETEQADAEPTDRERLAADAGADADPTPDAGEDGEPSDEADPFEAEDPFADDGGSPGDEDADEDSIVGGDEDPFSGDEDGDPFSGGADEDPFTGDADADPFSGDAGGDDGPFDGGEDPFDEDGDPFDGGDADSVGDEGDEDGDSLFEDDFEEAFQNAPGLGGGGEEDFEEEDFESQIPRIELGIEGLDAMIQGGVPERHLIVAIGSAGTGKTTFGLQFLQHGLSRGENAVFITLEQSHDAIVDTAAEHGWEFADYEAEDRLAVVDLDPVEMANSLDNIRGELPALIEQFDADRLVLDSVSLLEMMYDDQARRRTEVFDFTRSLKRAGVTTMLTSEASETNAYASRHGIIEYLTDAVFVLQYVRDETSETRLAVEIQKIRDANHSRETKPYEIATGGISVYSRANIF